MAKKILSELQESVLKSIFNHAIYRDEWNIHTETEIIHNNDVVGYVKYDLTKETIYGTKSNDYDVPNDPDEVVLTLNEAYVEIYGQTGEVLKNLSEKLNELLYKSFGKKLKA